MFQANGEVMMHLVSITIRTVLCRDIGDAEIYLYEDKLRPGCLQHLVFVGGDHDQTEPRTQAKKPRNPNPMFG